MVVSPLEYRYGREQIKRIFDDENRLYYMLKVEAAISKAEAEYGIIPPEAAEDIGKVVADRIVQLQRVREIEAEIKHDVMAMVKALSEKCKVGASYVHYGVTSNDVNDTATALQMHDFFSFLKQDIEDIMETLIELTLRYKSSPMMGRTHGQHASPITIGLKFAVYLSEFSRHYDRMIEMSKRAFAGKVLGPVGTGAALGPKALDIQNRVMEILGIYAEEGPTQIVNRDRYIEYLSVINGISVTLEKIGTEIRNLQRPEIDEMSEYFDVERQVGSSSMPSKVNPINSENVVSLSRLIRSMIIPEYEAGVTWHERDLTNSALERFTIPYSSILVDYILVKMNSILSSLIIKEDKIRKNLEMDDSIFSESLVAALTQAGMPRQDAHEFIRRCSMKARSEGKTLKHVVVEEGITNYIRRDELDRLMDPANFIGSAPEICDIVVNNARRRLIN
ncbi:adenylosuccinate lyase [Thermoplasma volcanium GSS1]|uniref:Adenylosuccinate lyase n=1 Tax=Thermoplasma volcanium (strain ATCC 51530 / DSM 4299 / JCM 9571 / NBRC 15438 / GSS1) TaxID=273116 RepID=Q979Y2_THEVO|nr:adenylosuccinate lyase [Thermoplasma volcanium]BAB60170.1 adenylosuccinate lyase [Thermoplasma volcanium GSS1]